MSYSTRDYIVSMTNFNSGHSMNVRITADSNFEARRIAEAQYAGSGYKIMQVAEDLPRYGVRAENERTASQPSG